MTHSQYKPIFRRQCIVRSGIPVGIVPECLLIFFFLFNALAIDAQVIEKIHSEHIDADSMRREFDKGPYFSFYKDNYFIFGPSVGPKATKKNTNVKFQISIRQKLTKSTLPGGTYLFYVIHRKHSGIFLKILFL